MGVIISTSRTSPLSLVSTVIGFVSFAFTVATFLRIIWVNLETVTEAPHEVHGYLTNLRTEILEEEASIRTMRKQAKKYHRMMRRDEAHPPIGMELDQVTLKTMSDQMKMLIREFKAVESPFLAPGSGGIDDRKKHRQRRRDSSASPYYEHSAYASPPEKGGRRSRSRPERRRSRRAREEKLHEDEEEEDDDERFWAQRVEYSSFSLRRRIIWIWKKPKAQDLFSTLSRVQVRRTARQVGGISYIVHEYGTKTIHMQDAVRRIEERMNTIVGVRRVDGNA